jgi:hypothetical protein
LLDSLKAQFAGLYQQKTNRDEFKASFVAAWKKANGVAKANLAYQLRRRWLFNALDFG